MSYHQEQYQESFESEGGLKKSKGFRLQCPSWLEARLLLYDLSQPPKLVVVVTE